MASDRDHRTIHWYRTPLDRDNMRVLNQRSDWKGLRQAGGHVALLALLGTLTWHVQDRLYLLLPLLFLYGTCYIFLLNATHELCHGTVFKSKWLNFFFLRLFCFLGWRSHILFWTSHTEHHKYTLHQPDDLEVVLPAQMGLKTFLRAGFIDPWTFWTTLKQTVSLSLGKINGEWENHLFPPSAEKKRRALFNWARLLLIGHGAIVAASIHFQLWLLPCLTTFGVFYGGWLRYLCNGTQHAGLQDDVPDFRLCTRTVRLGPFTRFLYWQMNYHIEHHMYAAVPCYNLAKLHKLIEHELPPTPKGLFAAWKEIIAILKRQQTEPQYQHIAKLPGPNPI